MSIISNHYPKVASQSAATYVLNPPLTTGASRGNLITASNNNTVTIDAKALHAKLVVDSQIVSMELESEVFTVPVARLIDLWLARFGNTWVDMMTLEDDPFFKNAFNRLKQLGEVEVHYLTDRARYVCRKPE